MPRKIIIGYESTPQGEDALALGGVFAELLATSPTVATAVPGPSSQSGTDGLERALEAEGSKLFAIPRDRLRPLVVETRAIADPSPASALYHLAEAEQASLVVVGSTHRGRVGRVLPGGVAESLLHGAPCAVSVAPRGFAQAKDRHLRRIAIAFDGSAEAWAALETGIGLAERTHGSLGLLTVAEAPRNAVVSSMAVLSPAELQDLERREKERVQQLAHHRVPSGLPAERRLLTGDAGAALAEAAADFDLIVAGSRGYGPLRRTILGSASAQLVREASCPVLVLPRGAGVDPLGVGSHSTLAAVP
ncbi:MAG TPA: universal stress protein [Solirubrobacterales bacterium]|nr:universal stress protein [Solirubrobacterales bacterium]